MKGVFTTLPELIALKQKAQFDINHFTHAMQQKGLYHQLLRGRGMEFAEVRNYQAGDEIRHMEWRVTARTGRPYVKLYHEERERSVFMIVDFNPSMYFGTKTAFKSVIAAQLATLIAARSIKNKDKVGGICFNAKTQHLLTPQLREKALMHFLGTLVTYTQYVSEITVSLPIKPFSDILLRMQHVIKPGSLVVIISDFYAFDTSSEPYLSQLREHNDLLAFHIMDPLETAPPSIPGIYPMVYGNQSFICDTSNQTIAHHYQILCTQRQQSIKTRCQKVGVHWTPIMTNTALLPILFQTFSKGQHARK